MADREQRFIVEGVQARAANIEEPSTLEGYGAVFGRETVIAGFFRERIEPGAFTQTLKDDDICVFFNHDANYVLGRASAGTATITEDDAGLRYRVAVNADDPDHVRVAAKVARGDVKGSSFSFMVESDSDEEWVRDDPAKLPLRIIKRCRVFDCGPVTMPAYPQTTATARSKAEALTAREAEAVASVAGPPGDVAALDRALRYLQLAECA